MVSLPRGHVGPLAADLVDGRLDEATRAEAWEHVVSCRSCRDLVERETWTKRQLATLGAAPDAPSARLVGALQELPRRQVPRSQVPADALAVEGAWSVDHDGRRRVLTAAVGAGAVGAAVLTMMAWATSPAGLGEVPGTPVPTLVGFQSGGAGLIGPPGVQDVGFRGTSR